MRIDVNTAALSQLANDRDTQQAKSKAVDSTQISAIVPNPLQSAAQTQSVQSGDTTTLSSQSRLVSSLTAAALQSPPVRQDKVDARSQALRSGQYEVNPSKVADAIIADRVG